MALTQSMAVNHAADNIRVNAIAPGGIRSERVAARLVSRPGLAYGKSGHLLGLGTPRDPAAAALFSHRARGRWWLDDGRPAV